MFNIPLKEVRKSHEDEVWSNSGREQEGVESRSEWVTLKLMRIETLWSNGEEHNTQLSHTQAAEEGRTLNWKKVLKGNLFSCFVVENVSLALVASLDLKTHVQLEKLSEWGFNKIKSMRSSKLQLVKAEII